MDLIYLNDLINSSNLSNLIGINWYVLKCIPHSFFEPMSYRIGVK